MSNPTTGQDSAVAGIPAGEYRVDPARSTITFRARHMFGLGGVRGSFTLASGQITVADPLESSAAVAVVDANTFATGNDARDRTVRSTTYLDTERYPEIVFSSTGLHCQDGRWLLDGKLTVRGSTQPVQLVLERLDGSAGELTALARTRIDRYAFGITAMKGMTGRYYELTVEITATVTDD